MLTGNRMKPVLSLMNKEAQSLYSSFQGDKRLLMKKIKGMNGTSKLV
jgi:hypothetical protein